MVFSFTLAGEPESEPGNGLAKLASILERKTTIKMTIALRLFLIQFPIMTSPLSKTFLLY